MVHPIHLGRGPQITPNKHYHNGLLLKEQVHSQLSHKVGRKLLVETKTEQLNWV